MNIIQNKLLCNWNGIHRSLDNGNYFSCLSFEAKRFISPFVLNVIFYAPWKLDSLTGFLMLSGGIKIEHWEQMNLLIPA